MPTVLKRNAVIVFALAAFFYWSFMFAKQDPALRNVIPFGDDPYDAVGSFGVIIGMLIALISFLRAFRPYREAPSFAQRVYLARSQEAVVLAVFITLASDAVAMGRHPSMWIKAASRDRLIVLLGVLVIVTIVVQLLFRAAQEKLGGFETSRWVMPAGVTLLAVLVLASYPEQLINGTVTHLLTVVAGAIVLFAPMRLLLNALLPYALDGDRRETLTARGSSSIAGRRWIIAMLAGSMIGAFAFLGEMGEAGSALSSGH